MVDALSLTQDDPLSTWPPEHRNHYQRTLAAVRAVLDPAAFEAAWAAGRALTLDQAIAYALDESAESERAAST